MSKNLLIGLGVFLAVVVVGFFLVRSPKPSVQNAQNSTPATSSSTASPVKEINISAKEFAYTPSSVSVNVGETVKINLTNDGTTTHNLTIAELGVKTKDVNPGESDSVTFTPKTTGAYTFFCSIDSHKDLGLQGTLEVR